MLQAVLVTRHKTKMKTVSAIREFTTELQLYFHMWVTSVSPWDASGGHSRAALGRCCSLLSKDQAQSPHYWSIPLKNPLSKTDLQLQWIHWIQIHSPISFNKTWINPVLENRIYNVTRFPGTTFWWLCSWWYNLWHLFRAKHWKWEQPILYTATNTEAHALL